MGDGRGGGEHTIGALSRDQLMSWGEALGRELRPSAVVAIRGELGSGKTTLVQAICRGYGVWGEVTSPTFALVHEYSSSRGPVYHLDLYRLNTSAELTNLAWDDIINSGALVLVEWPERGEDRVPAEARRIRLSYAPEDDRRILEADARW